MDNENESPELIEQRMHETRQSLTDKVSALEQQVVGTLHTATSSVQDTVQSVRSALTDTVSSVKGSVEGGIHALSDNVKAAFDVTRHVRDNPWASVGASAMAGFITGLLVFRDSHPPLGYARPAAGPRPDPTPMPPPRRPGFLDDLLERAGQELRRLGEQAVSTLSASVKQNIDEGLPRMVNNLMPEQARVDRDPAGRPANGFHG